MEIALRYEGRERHYTLTMDRREVERVTWRDDPVISPPAKDGATFWLYYHPSNFEESFTPMPQDSGGYYIYMGGDDINNPGDLERAIREKGEIPILIPGGMPGIEGKINVGYVKFKFRGEEPAPVSDADTEDFLDGVTVRCGDDYFKE